MKSGEVFRQAEEILDERDAERSEVWRRSGIKGQAFHCFAKAERGFQQALSGFIPNRDHYLDLINYAAFAVILIDDFEEGHDGMKECNEALNGVWAWGNPRG